MTTRTPLTPAQIAARIAQLPVFYREGALRPASRPSDGQRAEEGKEKEGGALEMSISSDAEIERTDWFGDRWIEVLDHSPGAVDLSYAAEGLPLFMEHSRYDQVGILDDVRLDGGKLRGAPRFSRGVRGQEAEQDVRDGIRKNASVGYRILELVLERQDKESGIDYYRVTKWRPVEGSLASIPADITVGVGRSADVAARPQHRATTAPVAKERIMSGSATADTGAAPRADTPVPPVVDLNQRGGGQAIATRIAELATAHGFADKIPQLLKDHAEVRTAAEAILDMVRERAAKPHVPTPLVDLNTKEQKRYSYARAIAMADERVLGASVDCGFEREVQEAIEKKLPSDYKRRGGILIPTVLRRHPEWEQRAGLDSGTATKGAELKFTQPGEFIELLRARMRLRQLGARLLAGLTGPVTFPRQSGGATGSWVGENPGSDVAESNLLLGTVALAFKTYQSTTSFSRQLLFSALSASVDSEQLVREDLVADVALAIDKAGIRGTGSSNQPRGVINTSGIGSVAIGTNGGVPTYEHMVDLESAIAVANADIGELAYLTTPGIRGKLRKTQEFSGTNGQPVWTGGQEGEVLGYRALSSTQVPADLTKGTASGICHAVIFGVFSQLLIGEWGALELIVDPLRLKKQAMIEVTTYVTADIALRQTAAFAAILDALTS